MLGPARPLHHTTGAGCPVDTVETAQPHRRSKQQGRAFALLLMEIDQSKSLTGTNGNPFTDLLLRRMADVITTAKTHRAVALIVRSPLSRAVGNFFLGLNKPVMPMRLFSDEATALDWLRGIAHAA